MDKEKLDFYLECKDYTVSGETFTLYKDKEYDMLVTSPKPDSENLGKYYESNDYISHTDARRSFVDKLYQIVKKYALVKKVKLIDRLNEGSGVLLDIGAGTGDFLIEAKKRYWDVKGVEPSEIAKSLASEKGIKLLTDTKNLPSNTFDVITMWHVLEHVPDLSTQIKEVKRLLKGGGYLVVAVPNFRSYDATYYKSFWAAYDVPRHLWHFSKDAIKAIFEKNEIYLEKTKPLVFDSFYVSLLSEKYKSGKMNFVKSFWIGFVSNLKASGSKEYSSHIYVLKSK